MRASASSLRRRSERSAGRASTRSTGARRRETRVPYPNREGRTWRSAPLSSRARPDWVAGIRRKPRRVSGVAEFVQKDRKRSIPVLRGIQKAPIFVKKRQFLFLNRYLSMAYRRKVQENPTQVSGSPAAVPAPLTEWRRSPHLVHVALAACLPRREKSSTEFGLPKALVVNEFVETGAAARS